MGTVPLGWLHRACSDTTTNTANPGQDALVSTATPLKCRTFGQLSAYDGSHLDNVRQLTYGSETQSLVFDGRKLVFQATNPGWNVECDQIYVMDLADGTLRNAPSPVSTGLGRTTCAYFMPGDSTTVRFHPRCGHRLSDAEPQAQGRIRVAHLPGYDITAPVRRNPHC